MPIYDYRCEKHGEYEVYKSIKEYDGKDQCPKCGKVGTRLLSCSIQFIGAAVENPEYNPGLGMVVKNKYHRSEICKAKNLIEIGNEKPDSIHKMYDKQREDVRKKRWESD